MVTATDYFAAVAMKGYIRQLNLTPFLPDGAKPEVETAPSAGYAYKPVIDRLWSFVSVAVKARVIVELELARDAASAPSLTPLFKAADWQGRETFDLVGVKYEGHPN